MGISQRWKNLVASGASYTVVAIIFFVAGAVVYWLARDIITRIVVPYAGYVAAFVMGIIVCGVLTVMLALGSD